MGVTSPVARLDTLTAIFLQLVVVGSKQRLAVTTPEIATVASPPPNAGNDDGTQLARDGAPGAHGFGERIH